MLRGIDGRSIFASDFDRCRLCLFIQEAFERFQVQVHAYCFMSNHIHLAVRVGAQTLSLPMHRIAFRYASYYNRTNKRRGYLFQERFKSILVQEERYLEKLVRYIHLNPVRAGIVKGPEQYTWSSHKEYLGLRDLVWLEQRWMLVKYGETSVEARRNFEKFILAGIGEESEINFSRGNQEGVILGDDAFIEEVSKKVEESKKVIQGLTVQEVVQRVADALNLNSNDFHGSRRDRKAVRARGIAALIVRDLSGVSMRELGTVIGRDSSVLGRAANQVEMQARECESLTKIIEDLQSGIRC